MVLKTKSCNLLTVPSKSSPSAAMAAVAVRQWPQVQAIESEVCADNWEYRAQASRAAQKVEEVRPKGKKKKIG
jgi:hypothetical protein